MTVTSSVRLISHASVLIEVGDVAILTDPWQFGSAFNDSWNLIADPAELSNYLAGIQYLWISHEHPDHFHAPTLRSLPAEFRERVVVLFQESSDHPKMVEAFRDMLGYPNVRLLPHRTWVPLSGDVAVYCYQSRQQDSALAVRGHGVTVLNLNDCEVSDRDLVRLRADVGAVDVLLNQFSIAGFDGIESRLPRRAREILDNMVRDHLALDAKVTIPFASMVYFCCPDNNDINDYVNAPAHVAAVFEEKGLGLVVLRADDAYVIGEAHDNAPALADYARVYERIGTLPLSQPRTVGAGELAAALLRLRKKLVECHGRIALLLLSPIRMRVPDLETTFEMSLRHGYLRETRGPPDIEIHSQPLYFMLANDFGLQTLGVSCRFRLFRKFRNMFRHRALVAMLNAGIGLAPRHIVSRRQLAFFWKRRRELLDQLRYRFRTGTE
ncbi:MAG TPA: MBL fold metallo-hydrolase [Burkholderiales bacterium]|nr:MBL fold metallo-hydrolase [Burkholderiales bacterium]